MKVNRSFEGQKMVEIFDRHFIITFKVRVSEKQADIMSSCSRIVFFICLW